MTGKSQTNLIINYLPQTLTDEEFTSMFESIGPLNASKIVRDRHTGYSYGFGFVDFVSEADAMRAVDTLNGLHLQNKRIKVAFARTGDNIKGGNLYVRNLPVDMNQDQVHEIFTPYGTVVQCRVLTDQGTGMSKGIGFVLFETRNQAQEAIDSLNGHVLEGYHETLSVQFAEDNKGKARPPAVIISSRGRGAYPTPGGRGGFGGASRGGGGFGGRGGFGGVRGGGGYGVPGRGRGTRGGYGVARGAFNGGTATYDNGYESNYGPIRTQNQNRFRYNPMSGGGGGASYNSGYTSFNGNGAGAGAGAGQEAAEEEGYVLFAYNIGAETDERGLWQLFSPFGIVQKVNVIRDGQKGTGKGYGFVTMSNYHEATNAIQALDGYRFTGKPLQVSFKTKK